MVEEKGDGVRARRRLPKMRPRRQAMLGECLLEVGRGGVGGDLAANGERRKDEK